MDGPAAIFKLVMLVGLVIGVIILLMRGAKLLLRAERKSRND